MRENPSEKKMSLKEYWKSVLESWSETKCSKKVYQWLDLETAELQNHVLHFKYWATVKFPPKSVSRNSNYFSDFRLSPPKVGKINYINPICKWRNSELYDSVDKYYIENLGKHLCALESLSPIPLYFHSQLLGLILTMFSWVSISIFFSYSLHHSLSSLWDNEFTGKWSNNTESEYFQRFTECNTAQDKKYHFVTPSSIFCMLTLLRYIRSF